MENKWRQCEWGDIAVLEYGKSLRNYRNETGQYRVYGTNGPIGWYSEPLCMHPGVIVGRKGAYRGIHYSPEPFFVIDTAFYLKPKQDMDPRWAYYCLLTYDINGMDSGSAIPSTSRESFYRLPVRVPPLPEQRVIAHILGTLDDRIEINRQMNQTLEAMAQAIFENWFVDFEPFRDQGMQSSSLGEIPVGWKVEPLGDHFEVVRGLSHKGEYLADNGMPLHNLNSVYEGGGYKYEGMKFYKSEYQDKHTVIPGDVIVTNTEQGFDFLLIGYPAIVPRYFGSISLFSHHLFRLRPLAGSPLTNNFAYLLLKIRNYHEIVAGYTNGTTVNMLQQNDLRRLPTIVPSAEISIKFEKHVASLLMKTEQIHDESSLLSTLRDALLPKLLSGEIRVKDSEKFVERAL